MINNFDRLVENYFKNDYRERGVIKWQGFLLSDHTNALKKNEIDNHFEEIKFPLMTVKKIKDIVTQAMSSYEMVVVQLNVTDTEHKAPKNITGFIDGYDNTNIYINNKSYDIQFIKGIVKYKHFLKY